MATWLYACRAMIIQPRIRGGICTTAHPEGCARHVRDQIDYVRARPQFAGPKNVLVIGASTGYGLASRIVAAFGARAKTLGVFFERPAEGGRTASAGWYNTAAFEAQASREGLWAGHVNGDAFSDEIKSESIAKLRKEAGPVDLVVYSLASPRRTHPRTGETHKSALKPVGRAYTSKSVDSETGKVTEVTMEPADEKEIADTIAVMGGEDWGMWMDALGQANMLAPGALTVAYSYIGPKVTHAIYRSGTIGKAKEHIEATAAGLTRRLAPVSGRALVSVNKAVVTQSSAAIPAVPLYITLLFRVMKDRGLHEDTIEQCHRLFTERLYGPLPAALDEEGRIRLDDWEMRDDVQQEVARRWERVTTENIAELADLDGYRGDFLKLFGFGLPGIDYTADVDPNVSPTL